MYTLRARQLKNASLLSLFSGAHQLVLKYPAESKKIVAKASIQRGEAETTVSIAQAGFPGQHCPVIYAAVGILENDLFHPLAVNCNPKFPCKFTVPAADLPLVLQLNDAFGSQGFTLLE